MSPELPLRISSPINYAILCKRLPRGPFRKGKQRGVVKHGEVLKNILCNRHCSCRPVLNNVSLRVETTRSLGKLLQVHRAHDDTFLNSNSQLLCQPLQTKRSKTCWNSFQRNETHQRVVQSFAILRTFTQCAWLGGSSAAYLITVCWCVKSTVIVP